MLRLGIFSALFVITFAGHHWNVTNDSTNKTCIIFDADSVTVTVKFTKKNGTIDSYNTTINSNVSVTGNCVSTYGNQTVQELQVQFLPAGSETLPTESQPWTLQLTFGSVEKNYAFKLLNYSLQTAPARGMNSSFIYRFTKANPDVDFLAHDTDAFKMVNTAHVSSSSSTLSAQKKRQDERNLKTLRELSALPANRFCFECGQRGPTYVNITIGSFCCTSCSGILRGLNPPHRVKSICMATFTNEEIERIRSLGNEENSHTWLGLYSGTPPKMTNKEEFTAFLIRKYEKKEWYVSRTELEEQERLLNQAKEVASQCGSSVKSAGPLVSKPSDLDLFSSDQFSAFGSPVTRPTAQPSHESVFHPVGHSVDVISSQPFSPPAFVAPPPPLPAKPPVQNNLFTSQVCDPFSFAAPKSSSSDFDPFADFDVKFGELSLKNSSTLNAFGSPLQVQPLPKSATITSSFPTQLVPEAVSANPFRVDTSSWDSSNRSELGPTSTDLDNNDKYSALAELDQMFHHTAKSDTASKEKPAWLPSGFSTGLPPAHYTQTFCDYTQMKPSTGLSSMPKSNTLGAIPNMETSAVQSSTSVFNNMQHQALSNSYASITSNPFTQQPVGAQNPQQRDQSPFANPSNVMTSNPFAVPYIQAHYGTGSLHDTGGAQNWNPFL